MVFGGINTYTGTTTIGNGTVGNGSLSISADSGLGAVPGSAIPGSLTLNGGTLTTTTSFTLGGDRGISLGVGGGTLAPGSGSVELTYNGIISGTGRLTEASPSDGNLVLTGANTYSGGTTIDNAYMYIFADNNLGFDPDPRSPAP